MKKLLFVLLSIIGTMAYAQELGTPQWTKILSGSPQTFQTQLISSSENSIQVNVQVPGFYTTTVTTPKGEAYVITVPKSVSTAHAGEPDVPMTGIPLMIGDKARMDARVIDAQYKDFEGIEIAPSKGDFPRSIDPATVPYTYGECYRKDAFFPASNLDLYEPYIIRDFRGQNMAVFPFAYNPVTKTLRVYYNMTVELYKVDNKGANAIESRRDNVVKMDPDFKSLYQRHFLNFEESMAKYTPITEDGDLLIICYDSYMSYMIDFVNWKKTRGINTTIVGTSTAGSTYSAIQTYIKNQYNANNNITHVLLVGDVGQIPGYSYSGGGSSYGGKGDNAYGQIVGSDIYNDVIIGRFSANSTSRVTTQANRAITYERDLTTSATWLKVAQGISRKEGGSGHNSEDDYQHIDNIRTDLLNYGYSTVYQRYANLSGYTATSSQISSDINSGVGIINYANHGQETAWGANSSGYVYYANSHVNALTNENKLPFVFSVACLVGKYDHSSDCFAEAWMNATNNNNPTGAIGTLMSYISQPWIPPMWGQDNCIDILTEQSNTRRTFGGISINGLMGIFDHYSTSEQQAVGTYQAWIVYGDPTLMVRTSTPTAMTVSHNGSIASTATSYTVNVTNGNGAVATITDANHNILGKATVANNKATISLTAPGTSSSSLTLCVFGYNKVTYLGTITVSGGGSSTTNYTVSASASPSAGGTVTGAGTYAENSTCTLKATPASGYEFTKWTKNGTQVSTNATYSFTVTGNATYVANFSEVTTPDPDPQTGDVTIGSGTSTNAYLPTYAYYKYSLTEQIYTASEIGGSGTITAVSFKVSNSKSTTRTVDLYLKHTTKSAFSSNTGWETLSSSDKVYSGSVTFNSSGWTTITLSTPFVYNGTSNLIIGMDDNTGSYVSSSSNSPKFYVYSTSANRALRIYSDNTNYTPSSATSYSGTYITSNNQVMLIMSGGTTVNSYTITASASPTAGGTVTGAGTYQEGSTVTLKATANTGYTFSKWTKNGTQVSTSANYSFTATADGAYVAVFTQNSYSITASASPTAGGTVSGAGTYTHGSTATLKATANSGYTFTNWTKSGSVVSTNATYSFTVTAAGAYVANFAEEQTTTYYNVTVASVSNGTVTANKTTAAAGETVTLTATPTSGATFDRWIVYKTGDITSTISVSNNKFTMPSYDVTVAALFKASSGTGTGTGTNTTLTIGSGTSTNAYIPTYAYYKYSLTEQIYTASEIGQAGTITAVSFKVSNSKSTARTVDLYMKATTKSAFSSKTGWETLSSSDKVYSGSVTFNASGWTTITLSTPFVYDGTSNLVIGMDDNTGSYVSSSSNSPKFYVYSTSANRALRIYSDNTNYNPASPSSYSGTYVTSNNQIQLAMTTVGGGTATTAETLFVTPTALTGFNYTTGNGPSSAQSFAIVGADLTNAVTVTAPANYEISTSLNGTYGSTVTFGGSKGNRGTQTWGFEGSTDSWTTIDADGDGYNWQLASVLMSGYSISAHGGSDMISSESYNKATTTALTPDNWLVSPQVTLGGTFSLYACAQDANYAAEHFGIYVSTSSNTNTGSFTKLNEWTLAAKTQGSWGQYTVDLSAYAGQTGYIAVRHFNCTDQFYLNVDDITLTYDETPVTPDPEPTVTLDYLAVNVYVRLKAGLSAGSYNNKTVTVTSGTKSATVTLSGTVSSRSVVDELTVEGEKPLSLYPNPAERGEAFHVALPEGVSLEEARVEVFNVLGALVHTELFTGDGNEIRESFAAGVYTVRVTDTKGAVYFGKLVVR